MSLYPTTIVPLETALEQQVNEIANGGLVAIPITVGPGDAKTLLIVHQAPTQDHSLRCFLSDRPGGTAVGRASYPAVYWHANRLPNEPVVIAVEDRDVTSPAPVIRVTPGSYFINILNLVNTSNGFAISLLDL